MLSRVGVIQPGLEVDALFASVGLGSNRSHKPIRLAFLDSLGEKLYIP
jgi:hypothetical protein